MATKTHKVPKFIYVQLPMFALFCFIFQKVGKAPLPSPYVARTLDSSLISLMVLHYHFVLGLCVVGIGIILNMCLQMRSKGFPKFASPLFVVGTVSFWSLGLCFFILMWNHQTIINQLRNGFFAPDSLFDDTIYLTLLIVGFLSLTIFRFLLPKVTE